MNLQDKNRSRARCMGSQPKDGISMRMSNPTGFGRGGYPAAWTEVRNFKLSSVSECNSVSQWGFRILVLLAVMVMGVMIPEAAYGIDGVTEFTYNKITYKVISEQEKTCEVSHFNKVSGDIIIPSKVYDSKANDYKVIRIGMLAFKGSDIKSIMISNSVTSIGNAAFQECYNLTSVEMPTSIKTIGNSAFESCMHLSSIAIPNSVTTIGSNAFYNCESLDAIDIPNSVTEIGERAFYMGVNENTEMAYLHKHGPSSIHLGNSIKTIGSYAFASCILLTSIEIPNSVTSLGEGVFANCTKLSSVVLSQSLTEIGGHLFKECAALESIIIPNTVTSIGDYAFYKCDKLKSVNIPVKVSKIGNYSFSGCKSLISIDIPNSVNRINNGAFEFCTSLTSVEIPNSVTYIGNSAFRGCTGLTRASISRSLATIGESALNRCTELKEIEYLTAEPIDGDINIFSDETYENATLFVGHGGLENARGIYPWCKFKTIVEKTIPAESVSISQAELVLQINESAKLTVTVLPENTTDNVTWSSDNPGIAIVSKDGEVTAVSIGRTSIVATATSGVFAICEVTVNPTLPEEITLNKTAARLRVPEELQLTATVSPETTTDKTVAWNSSNPAVATVDATGKVTAISIGESIVTASCGDVKATCAVTVVATPAEGITLSQETASLEVAETIQLTATVSPETTTDKTVVWNSSNPEVATVYATGKVTAISIGESIVTASCGAVKATCAVTVVATPAEGIALSQETASLEVSEIIQLTATVSPETTTDKTVAWSSSNPAVATVDATGKVTAISIGESIVTASCGDVKATCAVTVVATPAEGIALSQETASLEVAETVQLTATVSPETTTDKTVAWSTSNPEVATVDASGNVTAISIGETIVTASCGAVKATCTVTVVATPAEGIALSQETASLEVAETVQLTATVSPETTTDKTVAWSSSNPEIATVDASGNVTAISIGETIVTASCGAVNATCIIKVEPTAIQSISLNPSNWSGFDGESFTISASISPVNATDKTLEWTSSDESIAVVDNNGNVNIVGIGECIITVAATDGSGVTDTCAVTVNPILVESVSLDPTEWSGMENSQFRITATVLPENATDKTLEWTSSDDMIATVDDTGLVSVQKEGSCIISVKTADGSDIVAECKINSTSGIGDVFIGADEKFDIYNIAGIIIKKECSSQNLKELLPGAYILRQGSEIRKIIIR